MPYRERLNASTTDNSQILKVWRHERSYRVGKALCFSGLVLSFISMIADYFWSAPSVFYTDLILIVGCGISIYWLNSPSRPTYYWWPLFWGLWMSIIPSLWTTGGLHSPFFGVAVTAIFVIGTVLDSKNRSIWYIVFSLLHIPAFYLADLHFPMSVSLSAPLGFTALITGLTLISIFICIHAILNTEHQLSLEFSDYYRNLDKTRDELKNSERQLREAQSIAAIGSWEWDLKTNLIAWSDELFRIYDIQKKDFDPSFHAYLQRLHPDKRHEIQSILQHSLGTGTDFVFENTLQTSRGIRYLLSRGRCVRNSQGIITKMLGTSQDITDRKDIESQLMAAKAELEQRVEERTLQLAQSLEREKNAKEIAENASQAKMQFLANMSHEIRTPMNSILGFSELLDSEDFLFGEGKEYLARIRANGKQLLHLIDDILDLSKFEAGRIPIHKSSFNLKNLIDDILDSFLPSLKGKRLELKTHFEMDESLSVKTDSQRLGQILVNLISNGIKFSEAGTIQILIRQQQTPQKNQINLQIQITDSGIGISSENQKVLFKPFTQGDSSIVRKFGGSGLGLVLSRKIAEALGGSLELKQSSLGHGSTFLVQIPVEIAITESKDNHETFSESQFDHRI